MSGPASPERTTQSRSQLMSSTREWSPLRDVALAVSVATEYETKLYVERLETRYRWSPIHRGGPYPLLRITARFLGVDHDSIFIGFRGIDDDHSALSDHPGGEPTPSASGILTFDGPTPLTETERTIREALG